MTASILKSTLIEFLSCQLNLASYSVNGPPLPRLGVGLDGRAATEPSRTRKEESPESRFRDGNYPQGAISRSGSPSRRSGFRP